MRHDSRHCNLISSSSKKWQSNRFFSVIHHHFYDIFNTEQWREICIRGCLCRKRLPDGPGSRRPGADLPVRPEARPRRSRGEATRAPNRPPIVQTLLEARVYRVNMCTNFFYGWFLPIRPTSNVLNLNIDQSNISTEQS